MNCPDCNKEMKETIVDSKYLKGVKHAYYLCECGHLEFDCGYNLHCKSSLKEETGILSFKL